MLEKIIIGTETGQTAADKINKVIDNVDALNNATIDAYTKTETDTKLAQKADTGDSYSKTETDTALDGKVDKVQGKVLSSNDFTAANLATLNSALQDSELNQPVTVTNKIATMADVGTGSGSGSGDMLKSVYDTNGNGKVDKAEEADNALKVNSLTVETAVPAGALFTDTKYDDTQVKADILSGAYPAADKQKVALITATNPIDLDTAITEKATGANTVVTGYVKATSGSPITVTDSVNSALGKLEKGLESATAGGGEDNVQVDWSETDAGKDEFIKNKPTIPVMTDYYNKTETDTKLGTKVDAVQGKGLSANDYEDADKAKVGHITITSDRDLDAIAGDVTALKANTEGITKIGAVQGTPEHIQSIHDIALAGDQALSQDPNITAKDNRLITVKNAFAMEIALKAFVENKFLDVDNPEITDIASITKSGIFYGGKVNPDKTTVDVTGSPVGGPIMVMASKDPEGNFGYFLMGHNQVLHTGGKPKGQTVHWSNNVNQKDIGDIHSLVSGHDLVWYLEELKKELQHTQHATGQAKKDPVYCATINIDGDQGGFIMGDLNNPVLNPAVVPAEDIKDTKLHWVKFQDGAHPVPNNTTWLWFQEGGATHRMFVDTAKSIAVAAMTMRAWIDKGSLVQIQYDSGNWYIRKVQDPVVQSGAIKALLSDGSVKADQIQLGDAADHLAIIGMNKSEVIIGDPADKSLIFDVSKGQAKISGFGPVTDPGGLIVLSQMEQAIKTKIEARAKDKTLDGNFKTLKVNDKEVAIINNGITIKGKDGVKGEGFTILKQDGTELGRFGESTVDEKTVGMYGGTTHPAKIQISPSGYISFSTSSVRDVTTNSKNFKITLQNGGEATINNHKIVTEDTITNKSLDGNFKTLKINDKPVATEEFVHKTIHEYRTTIDLDTAGSTPTKAECITAFKHLPNFDWSKDDDYYIRQVDRSKMHLIKYRALPSSVDEATAGEFWIEALSKAK